MVSTLRLGPSRKVLVSMTVFNDSHNQYALDAIPQAVAAAWSSPLLAQPKRKDHIRRGLHNRRAELHGERKSNKMHMLVGSCLAVAYLSANVYAIVKVRVFELARSRKHLLLYGIPFILWGSLILLGCKLMEIMRRFDDWFADSAPKT